LPQTSVWGIFILGVFLKKELTIFMSIFLFLAIGMHFKEWISHPIDHILALPNSGAYGLGPLHPLIFVILVYLIFIFFRAIKRIIVRKK
jgi:hypothetical protein